MATTFERSGQVTVTTAGTAVQGPDVAGSAFMIRANPANTNPVFVGNVSGDVDSANGYPLKATDPGVEVEVSNLKLLWFDATTNGEKIAWLRLR